MKFCPKCGSALKEGNKFCNKCGFNIASYIENKAIKEENKRIESERLEKERLERERFEKERLERERLERERLEMERLEREKLEREKLERERLERERLERERLERERLERDRLERERLERERLDRERLEQEKLEKEKLNKRFKIQNDKNDIADKEKDEIVENVTSTKSKKNLLPMVAVIFILVLIFGIYINFLLNPNLNIQESYKANSDEIVLGNQNTNKRGNYKANHDSVVFSDKTGQSQVLGILAINSVVYVYDIDDGWAQIKYYGNIGYIPEISLDKVK